jgi:regulatory protein
VPSDHVVPGDDLAPPSRTPPPERSPDPEVRLQHACEVAWTALNRREHTAAELARILARKRVEPAVIDSVVGELCEQGYLDDAAYAQRFAEDRRRLDGWGAERIEQRLRALGMLEPQCDLERVDPTRVEGCPLPPKMERYFEQQRQQSQ